MPTDTFQSRRVGSSAQARRRIQPDAIDSSVLTRITRIFLACTVNDNTPFYSHRLGSNLTQFYLSYYFVALIAQKDLPTQDAKNHPRANEISCGVPQTSTLFYFFSHFTLTILTMLLVYSIWYCVRRRFMSQKRSRLSFRYVNLEMGKLSVSFIAN